MLILVGRGTSINAKYLKCHVFNGMLVWVLRTCHTFATLYPSGKYLILIDLIRIMSPEYLKLETVVFTVACTHH